MSDRYAAIRAHRGQYPVRLMCAALEVSVSGFNAAGRRHEATPLPRAAADERLRVHVRAAHRRSKGRYGAPRVHQELRADGVRTARQRVARLMREDGLVGRRARRRVRTTDSRHTEPVAPNLLGRRFDVADHPAPNRAWCGDQTYVPTREGWLFLSVLLDLSSRRVVGWSTSASLAVDGPLAARRMALAARRPSPGLVHHTDRGSTYASREYRAALAAHGVVPSMSRRGDCWDNSVAESFFSTLEHELLAGAASTGSITSARMPSAVIAIRSGAYLTVSGPTPGPRRGREVSGGAAAGSAWAGTARARVGAWRRAGRRGQAHRG